MGLSLLDIQIALIVAKIKLAKVITFVDEVSIFIKGKLSPFFIAIEETSPGNFKASVF